MWVELIVKRENRVSEFKREERYIVIKRKYLSDIDENEVRGLLERRGIETRECVVIESSWSPEYEQAWKMIENRFNGTSDNQSTFRELEEQLAEHKECIDKNIIEHNKLYDKCADLRAELEYWISQYGCECGHNSCKKCKDTQDAKILLTQSTKREGLCSVHKRF